jgi:hypothetical protein
MSHRKKVSYKRERQRQREREIEREIEKENTIIKNRLTDTITSLLNFFKNTRSDQENWSRQDWDESGLDQQKWEESDVFFQKCEQQLNIMNNSPEKKTIDRLESLLYKIIIPRLKNIDVDFTPQAAFKSKSKKNKPNKLCKSQSNLKKYKYKFK